MSDKDMAGKGVSSPEVHLSLDDDPEIGEVARLVMDHRVRHNILGREMVEKLGARVAELADRPRLRVVVLTGAGDKAFAGGADVREMVDLDMDGARAYITRLHELCDAVRRLPVPVIARIDGYCLGAGLELAASCDIRVAGDRASFGMPEVRVGLPSVIEAALLPRIMGLGRAASLLFTGESINAYDALSQGLVERVCPSAQLDDTVTEIVQAILQSGPEAIRLQKRLLLEWQNLPLDESIRRSVDVFAAAYATDEPRRCMQGFLDRVRGRKK